LNYTIFNLAKKSKVALLIKFGGLFSSLILTALISRELGLISLGQFNFFNQTISIASVISIFGINSQTSKRFPILLKRKIYNALKVYLINILCTVFVFSSFLGTAIILLLSQYNNLNLDATSIVLIGMNVVPTALSLICSFILISFGKIWQSALTKQGIIQIIGLLGTILLIKTNSLSLNIILSLILILRIILCVWMIFFISTIVTLDLKKFNLNIISKLVVVSAPLAMTAIITIVQNNWESFVIPGNFGILEFSYYSTASRLVFTLSIFLAILNASIVKVVSTNLHTSSLSLIKTQKILTLHSRRLTVIGILFLIIMILFGRTILNLWGVGNSQAYFILITLSIGQLANLLTGGSGQILIISGNTLGLMKIKAVEFMILISSTVLFIDYLGLIGLALSSVLSTSVSNFAMVFHAFRKTKLKALPF
jgi:O-antigen/teichoic acid export membrane protein